MSEENKLTQKINENQLPPVENLNDEIEIPDKGNLQERHQDHPPNTEMPDNEIDLSDEQAINNVLADLDLSEELIDEVKKDPQILRQFISLTREEHHIWNASYPPPIAFKQYQEIDASLPFEILGMVKERMRMTEKSTDQKHERFIASINYNTHLVNQDTSSMKLSMWLGFIVILVILIGGIYLTISGDNIVGIGSMVTAILLTVRVYIKERKEETKKKFISLSHSDSDEPSKKQIPHHLE